MNFHEYGNHSGNDDNMWQDETFAGVENDDFGFGDYMSLNQASFRRGAGYGMNTSRFFGQRGPPGHSGPRFMWGRGFGPAGPPIQQRYQRENKSLTFLMRCGVTKQNLKGLPNVLLQLMEPQHCGICDQRFDNFSASRLHYISKNHTKNQKKWSAQQAEVGSHRPRELPLKSRDLYCELCDVHITSKPHADSHYAGRPHRAIVEGRKNPKNPFLLQKGLEDRVDQLIRREKKFLKPIDESEIMEAKNEAKPTQPELYCDICKTSVTCTEQMTMHLNGKKHLSKEKQHILKMMKTPTNGNDPEAQAADALNNTEQNDQEDNYDWGKGSGTWDDDPQ